MNKPRVMLDSGAYTAFRQGITIDIDKYAQFVLEHGDEFAGCINLDSINDTKKSYENWKYLKSCGVNTIPVYHMVTGEEKWLQKYLAQTDHIAIGAVANLNTKQRLLGLDVIWKKYFVDDNDFPAYKIHGLGLTQIDQMVRYPWHSVDSFTPVISAVWGSVLLPIIRDDEFRYLDMSLYKISDQGNHKKGMTGSFTNLPPYLMKKYLTYFEENGFKLGEITNKTIRPRRGKKDVPDLRPPTLFPLLSEDSGGEERTLANHWEERMRWNLTMWTKLQERTPIYPRAFGAPVPSDGKIITGKKTIMYMGVSTTTHLSIFELVKPKLDILISYAYLTENISKAIKKYTK